MGERAATRPVPTFRELTFRRGALVAARFAPDPRSAIYSAAWEGDPQAVFISSPNSTESRDLGLLQTKVMAVSSTGQMAVLRRFRVSDNAFTHVGTLAQRSVGADWPRDLLDNVEDADWTPDGAALAVVHVVTGTRRLEYPIGKVLYEAPGWISNLRLSPRGDRLAFIDHPLLGDDGGTVSVVTLSGKKSDLTERWASAFGLAWSPSGDEVWFTATATGFSRSLRSVSLSGKPRELLSAPGTLTLHDVGTGGRRLVARRRRARGASADGKWALVLGQNISPPDFILLPTGVGQQRALPTGNVIPNYGQFISDSKRLLFDGHEPGHASRVYIMSLDGGQPRALTPEGFSLRSRSLSPDGKRVAILASDGIA